MGSNPQGIFQHLMTSLSRRIEADSRTNSLNTNGLVSLTIWHSFLQLSSCSYFYPTHLFLSIFIPLSFHLYLYNLGSWKQLHMLSGNYPKKVQRIKLTKYISWCLSDKAGNPSCFPSKQSDEEEPCVGVKIAQNKGGQQPSLPLLPHLSIPFSIW